MNESDIRTEAEDRRRFWLWLVAALLALALLFAVLRWSAPTTSLSLPPGEPGLMTTGFKWAESIDG